MARVIPIGERDVEDGNLFNDNLLDTKICDCSKTNFKDIGRMFLIGTVSGVGFYLLSFEIFNKDQTEITRGVISVACSSIITTIFEKIRSKYF